MQSPSDIQLVKNPPSFSQVDMDRAIVSDRKTYDQTIKKLKKRLLVVQQAYYHQNKRIVIVFEGWDASGKGGAIRQLTENWILGAFKYTLLLPQKLMSKVDIIYIVFKLAYPSQDVWQFLIALIMAEF